MATVPVAVNSAIAEASISAIDVAFFKLQKATV
jgi:hypothetical protein